MPEQSSMHSYLDWAKRRIDEMDATLKRRLITIEEVGGIAMCLVSDFARNVTGSVAYVDAGYHVMS
jgi:enoyl-[acyl-carrier-protein] reductase (NADH)